MDIQESDFFTKFSNTIMSGQEYTAYKVQIEKLRLERSKRGRFELELKGKTRTLSIHFYASEPLNTLFVLTGHIVRKGEPSPKELAALQKYVEKIESGL